MFQVSRPFRLGLVHVASWFLSAVPVTVSCHQGVGIAGPRKIMTESLVSKSVAVQGPIVKQHGLFSKSVVRGGMWVDAGR